MACLIPMSTATPGSGSLFVRRTHVARSVHERLSLCVQLLVIPIMSRRSRRWELASVQQRGKGRGQGCKMVSAMETASVSAQGEPLLGAQMP